MVPPPASTTQPNSRGAPLLAAGDAAESRAPGANFKFPGASVLQLISLLSASGRDICVHSVPQLVIAMLSRQVI